jgi:predicted amidohydrolase
MKIALIHELFHGPGGAERLAGRLDRAAGAGAELAVLPELPMQPWIPARRTARDEDAEDLGGPLWRAMSEAARGAGIAVAGGAIVRDPGTKRRYNRSLLFDRAGELLASYDKLHVPCEEGFWESDHYDEGEEPPRRIDGLGMPLGVQICSDVQRPQGSQMLAAQGVEAILAPRATPPGSYERWKTVLRANALTSAVWVVSVNRPAPESGVAIGGPSLIVAPDGRVVLETTSPLELFTLERDAVSRARRGYPGYLALRADLYARGWAATAAATDDRD